MKRKALSWLIALCLIVGLLPTAALAAEGGEDGEAPVVCTQSEDCEEDLEEPPVEETEDSAPVVSAVTALQERIDALPGADALAEMSADKQNEVYAEVCDIYDAIDELDAEEAGALDVSALEEVAAFFTQQIMPLDSKPTGEMSGDCSAEGSNVKWKLTQNDDGSTYTLTISGTGAMADYTNPTKPTAEGANIAPWYLALTADSETNAIPITEIIIGEEVTGLGDWAFAYTQIEDASFAEGVKEYGVRIYSKCPKLTTVDWTNFKPEKVWLDETDKIPYSGAAVPGNMFDQVSTLCNSKLDGKTYTDRLVLPAEVTAVGTSGFYGTGFTTVNFDNDLSGVKQIGYAASDASTTAEFSTLRRSSGGSSSSSSPSNSVTVSRTKNGDVTVSPKTAKKGDTLRYLRDCHVHCGIPSDQARVQSGYPCLNVYSL